MHIHILIILPLLLVPSGAIAIILYSPEAKSKPRTAPSLSCFLKRWMDFFRPSLCVCAWLSNSSVVFLALLSSSLSCVLQ